MSNTINNINFTANMDTYFVKKDKKRWQNIAKIYEEITPEYPDDTFNLAQHNDKYIVFSATNTNLGKGTHAQMNLCKHGYNDLMQFSDNEIAKKFKKILLIAHKNKDNYEKALEFSKSVGLTGKNKTDLMKIMNNHKKDTMRDISQYDTFLNCVNLEV